MLQSPRLRVDEARIAQAIWNGDAIIGTDGSVRSSIGAYGIAIIIDLGNPDPTLAAQFGGNLPEHAKFYDIDSHRTEAAALYAGAVCVRRLLERFPSATDSETNHSARFVLDNKSAQGDVDWKFDIETSVCDYLQADYDILQGIKNELEALPLDPSVTWVKGHQDAPDRSNWDELSNAAKANVYADEQCSYAYDSPTAQTGLFPDHVPGSKAALLHHGKLVPKKPDKHTTTAATAPRLEKYLIDKSIRDNTISQRWAPAIFEDIDWKSHGESIRGLPLQKRIQICKHIHNWTPTLRHRNRMDNSIDSRCFPCGRLYEDTLRVLRCPSEPRKEARSLALSNLSLHFSQYYTPLPMANLLAQTVSTFLDGGAISEPDYSTTEFGNEHDELLHALLLDAFRRQSRIGWFHFLRGHLTVGWKSVIKHFYAIRRPGTQHSPDLWMRKTIDHLWDLFRTIWHTRNGEKCGTNFEEQRRTATETTKRSAREMCQCASDNVTEEQSRILHRPPLDRILNWTKSHLDAYLATAEVILEQNVDPG